MLTRYRHRRPVTVPVTALNRDPLFNFVDRFFSDLATENAEATDHSWVPAMDILETEAAFIATADLPGLTKDDIDISLEDGVLSVSGERNLEVTEENSKGFRRIERARGSFRRSFTLPQGVDIEKVEATFTDGVLSLTLPKAEIVKARKIAIS